jgi:hypothetical protein
MLYLGGNLDSSYRVHPIQKYSDNLFKLNACHTTHAFSVNKSLYERILEKSLFNIHIQDWYNKYNVIDVYLSTEILKKRLAKMDAKSPFNIEYNPALENTIKAFLKNRPKAFERLMAVSEYYFPMFEEHLAKYNIPLELKYLAIVESALNPKAKSRVGASGLWQFMYPTGKQYNLEVTSYVDERQP